MNVDNVTLGARLQHARHALGLTQGQVGENMGLAISTISEIEAGKRAVSGHELYRFAKIYHRPLSSFFEAEETAESPGFTYLFRQVNESVLNRASLLTIEQLTDDYAEIEDLTGAPAQPMPPDYSGFGLDREENAETLAEMERARLGLGEAPLKELADLLDGIVGIRTFLVPVPNQNWSGLVVRDRGGRPCIAVNAKEPPYRRNFSLAHEYAHVLVHLSKSGVPQGRIDAARESVRRTADERFADAFASAFLMPRRSVLVQLEQILGAGNGTFTDVDLVHLAMRFEVSGQAMSSRLVTLRRMPLAAHETYWEHRSFKALAEMLGYDTSDPEDMLERPVLPARFRYLALKAYQEAKISLAKFAEISRENYYDLHDRLRASGELDQLAGAVS